MWLAWPDARGQPLHGAWHVVTTAELVPSAGTPGRPGTVISTFYR